MCSISEYLLDDVAPENVPSNVVEEKCDTTICRKCTAERASVVLQRKFSYCKSCFLQVVTHKFRSTIGKLKLKQMKDRILLIFSQSQSSAALLHLLESGMNESNHKKLKFHTDVLVIDDSILWPENFDPASTMSEILDILKQFPFKRYIVKLSSFYGNFTINESETLTPSDANDLQLKCLFDAVKSSTSKMDLLVRLRSRLSYECAKLLNCNKIFTSECATDVAVRMLSDTSLGRYSHVSYDTAVCDTRNSSIHLIRPLREIVSKEIALYNVFNGLSLPTLPSPAAMFNYDPSLQWETSLFISNLQGDFPSTVYTVSSMGDKLQKMDVVGKSVCLLCRMPFPENCANLDEELSLPNSADVTDEDKLKSQFCYGCQRIINDLDTLDYLQL